MLLYHGTSARHLGAILKHGLRPRGAAPSRWAGCPSRPDLVYLTDGAYAAHFARQAVEAEHERLLIVEVDTAALREERLLPDEDFLEQATRGQTQPGDLAHREGTMITRTRWFREHLERWRGAWTASLMHLGTCAHRGRVPRAALRRVVTIEAEHVVLHQFVDPSITLINHAILGAQYRALAAWLMGERVALTDISLGVKVLPPEHRRALRAMLADRRGWERIL